MKGDLDVVTYRYKNTTAEHQLAVLVMAYLLKLNMHFNNRPATQLVSKYMVAQQINQSKHQQSLNQ